MSNEDFTHQRVQIADRWLVRSVCWFCGAVDLCETTGDFLKEWESSHTCRERARSTTLTSPDPEDREPDPRAK